MKGEGEFVTIGLAQANLREVGRSLEELALLLEGCAHSEIATELLTMSLRLCEIRGALELDD